MNHHLKIILYLLIFAFFVGLYLFNKYINLLEMKEYINCMLEYGKVYQISSCGHFFPHANAEFMKN